MLNTISQVLDLKYWISSAGSQVLDWFGICYSTLSGALVASRKQMGIVGFSFLGCVTGIGGGTASDVVLGSLPVFWIQKLAYLTVTVSYAAF
jgi:uncharacterized membrane protein YeiH